MAKELGNVKQIEKLGIDLTDLEFIKPEKINGYRLFAEKQLEIFKINDPEAINKAVELMVGISVFFGVGDDVLDEKPLTPVLANQVTEVWRGIMTDPKPTLKISLRNNDELDNLLPIIGSKNRQRKFVAITKLAMKLRLSFDKLISEIEDSTKVEAATQYLNNLFNQIINGEQSTFEMIGSLRNKDGIDKYFKNVCIDGNTPAFLLIHFIAYLSKKKLILPTADDLHLLNEMSIYWQTADDLIDTKEDTLNNQPKAAYFILLEMAKLSQIRLLGGNDKDLAYIQNPWYEFLSKASPGEHISDQELFCMGSDGEEVLKLRIEQ